jgi:CelD/BcsL family acetyltransferase involved in cellulose biosynthesis
MRIVLSGDGRDFVRRDWSELVRADSSASFFHTPAYLKLYWEEFGDPEGLLLAFAEDDGAGQVGAAAFEVHGQTLAFLGGTEVTDYMGPVGGETDRPTVAKELLAALVREAAWSRADLRGLPEDSPWTPLLADAARSQGLSVDVVDDDNGVAPFLPLPPTWDDYLASLPSKLRHEIRRKARRLRAEAGPYRVVRSTAETLREDLDRFVELHRSSEGPKGVFMRAGMEIFFRRLGEAFLDAGIFRLNTLEVDGQRAAGTIGFAYRGISYLYNSAFDHGWSALSPGMVLVAEEIREAIEEGRSGFDLLRGDYDYKYRFGAYRRPIKRLLVER